MVIIWWKQILTLIRIIVISKLILNTSVKIAHRVLKNQTSMNPSAFCALVELVLALKVIYTIPPTSYISLYCTQAYGYFKLWLC